MKSLLIVANFNVFILLLAGASYILSWLLGIPVPMLIIPYGGSRWLYFSFLFSMSLILIFIWIKRGLVPVLSGEKYRQLYLAGHYVLATANFVLIGGIWQFIRAANISREDEYWAGVTLFAYIGPIGGVLCIAGLVMVYVIPRVQRGRLVDVPESFLENTSMGTKSE